jgi:protoheme IX farnesyltransferase
MAFQAMAPLFVLVPLSVMPVLMGRAGLAYLATALLLGGMFMYRADQLTAHRSNTAARRLLFASIVYLPLLFTVMLVDRV